MNNATSAHAYEPGDSVLVDVNGARVPGVVESTQGDQIEVMLAQPWTDESGNSTHSVTVPTSQAEPMPDSAELPG